jgi:plasmid maintenance system antidote protein VapI
MRRPRLSVENVMTKLKPIHPGEILREKFMVPFELNPNKLALALRVARPTYTTSFMSAGDFV